MQPRLFDDVFVTPETPEGSSNEFYTPDWFVRAMEDGWGGRIDLDPSAAPHRNTRARRFIVGQEGCNGLLESWAREDGSPSGLVYSNPPYKTPTEEERKKLPPHWAFGDQGDFVRKAHAEWRLGHFEMAVLLIQQAAIGAKYSHECIRDQAAAGFPIGRLRFEDVHGTPASGAGTFASAIVIFTKHVDRYFDMRNALSGACTKRGHQVWWIHEPPHLQAR